MICHSHQPVLQHTSRIHSTCKSNIEHISGRLANGIPTIWGTIFSIVKPKGTVSNRDAIGTRITIEVNGISQIREIASGRSAMGQNMRAAHFGLGKVENIDSVTVRWPSGAVESLTDIKHNRILSVAEPC